MKAKLTIFKNNKAGQPIKKRDGSVVEYNGKTMYEPALNGKINLPEGLPAGDYEVGIYQYESNKNPDKPPLKYYSGTIKEAWKKEVKPANQPSEAGASVHNPNEEDDFGDSVPF